YYCVVGDGEHLPFDDNTLDGITAVFVGHHMSDAMSFVTELARILKPDGWLLTNSVDWRFPAPDFPSQGLQKLLGQPASFTVRNAFHENQARSALHRCFGKVEEKR